MLVVFSKQQHAPLAHEVDDLRIRFEDTLAGKVFDLRCETSGIINRAIDFQSVTLADDKVVMAMARRRVHAASSGLAVALIPRARSHRVLFPRLLRRLA